MSLNLVSKIEAGKKQRARVVIGVTAAVLILVFLCILFIQLLFTKERIEIENHITEVAKQSAVAVDLLINGDFQTLNLYAHILEKEPKYLDNSLVKQGLQTAIKNTRFYSMGVAYPDGRVLIYDANKGFMPILNVKDFKYFKEGMSGHNFVDFINSDYDNDKLIVLYAVPVIKNGKVIALVTGANDAKDYTRAVDITSFNEEAVVHILDGTGDILLRDKKGNSVYNKSVFEDVDGIKKEVKVKALKDKNSVSYWFKDKTGERKVAAYIPVGYNNWKILAILPFSAISHNTNAVLRYAVIFLLLINIVVILGIRYNVLIRRRSDNMIMDMALQDDITHSLNKTSFYIEAEKILFNKKEDDDEKLAMLLMDIDNFKIINEVYDIKKGDVVLKEIADILSKNIAEKGIFARFNDDVFAILYRYNKESEIVSLIDNITEEVVKIRLSLKVIPSFGVYLIVDKAMPINIMCDKANIAKRTIKGLVGDRFALFDESLSQALLADKEIEDEMKPALEGHQFVMYLQPKIDMKTNLPCGSEALIRWNHPQKGLVPPYKFVPLFERNGFIVEVDKFMWEEACKAIKDWIDSGLEPLPVSVNISRIHFKYEDIVSTIENLVKKYNIPKKYLELELTESAFLDNEGAVNSAIIQLQELGYTIAMDDFGIGYSSLNMLRKLPVNVLKLDRGFINEASCTERGLIVLNHITQMARDLKATVVCEGIETPEQVNMLRNAGGDIAQGFYYAKPMPLEEYNNFVYHHEGAYN